MNGLTNFGEYYYQIPLTNDINECNQLGIFEDDFNNRSDYYKPIINIYLIYYPQNTFSYQNYWYSQPNYVPNQYSINNFSSPQQQPTFPIYNQLFMQSVQPIEPEISKKDKKKHKKKDKKNHKKKESKKPLKTVKPKKAKKSKKKATKENSLSFPYSEGLVLSGIIHYLTGKTGGNICFNGTIDIVGSSTQDESQNAKYLCDFSDLSDSSMWSPDNERNANILFDFKNRRIKLTHYSFHTPTDDTSDYPRYWKVECSNDLLSWTLVDTQNDVHSMNSSDVCNTFKCGSQQNEFYRYIKITSTGPCWTNNERYYFDLSAVEFYGFLKE